MSGLSTERLPAYDATRQQVLEPAIDRAAEVLASGAVVALPTETVYGLAGDITQPEAIAGIYEAKGRPSFNPLIVHVPGTEGFLELMSNQAPPRQRETARRLADAFWPGPLTLVVDKDGEAVSDVVTAGSPMVAVRVPAHPVFQAVLKRLGRPLAAPSANRSGKVSPTQAAHVMQELEGRISLVLDGGSCELGLESTILRITLSGTVEILREGPLSAQAIEERAGVKPLAKRQARPAGKRTVDAPGQLSSHYAPTAKVTLRSPEEPFLPPTSGSWAYLGWQNLPPEAATLADDKARVLSRSGHSGEAAHNLFSALRELDAAGADIIFAELAPEEGLGRAINDRLARAAAPREGA
jgi:L-threonylcarbamoyladenylate synthase